MLVARPDDRTPSRTQWTAINACLVPAAGLDGQEVVTAEGLGTPDALHPVQREMAVRGGSQCGYCTPGFVCSMAAEFYRRRAGRRRPRKRADDPTTTVDDVDHAEHEHGPNGFDLHALSGNLCRCTGYRPIRDAAYALGTPADGRPASRPPDASPRAGGPAHPDRRQPDGEFVRPARPGRGLPCSPSTRTRVLVAGSTDWGVEVNIRAPAPPRRSPSTGCPSCAGSRSATTGSTSAPR